MTTMSNFFQNRNILHDRPEPLHILKKTKSFKPERSHNPDPRRSSTGTCESFERPGADKPLTIPKKRARDVYPTIGASGYRSEDFWGSAYGEDISALSLNEVVNRLDENTKPSHLHPASPSLGKGMMVPTIVPSGRQKGRMRTPLSPIRYCPLEDVSFDGPPTPTPQRSSSRRPAGAVVLVPCVTVTPESRAIDDDTATLWSAVEISTHLSTCPDTDDTGKLMGAGAGARFVPRPVREDEIGSSRFGYLYDLTIDIVPTAHSLISDVLGNCTGKMMLEPGSTVLLLVEAQLKPRPPTQQKGHVRQTSDELIEDLEQHLGSTRVEYLQVRFKYSHSAFPKHQKTDVQAAADSSVQTRHETIVTAAIKRHNACSLWSPQPAPVANVLIQIVARHWGMDAAANLLQRMGASSRHGARKPANLQAEQAASIKKREVPPREDALASPAGSQRSQRRAPAAAPRVDSAGAIWKEIRRLSGHRSMSNLRRPSASRQRGKESSAPGYIANSTTPRRPTDRYAAVIRGQRSIGGGGLRNMASMPYDLTLEEEQRRSQKVGGFHRGDIKREPARWAWGAWWR